MSTARGKARADGVIGPRLAGFLVFLAAGAVLVLEIVSLRLIAPYVGLTLEMNTAVIGIALTAIAVGAWLGGQAADRLGARQLLGPLFGIGGVAVLTVSPLVRWTGEGVGGGSPAGAVVMAVVAIFIPAALLSAVAPVVVKLRLSTLTQTGTVVGQLSSLGTVGAVAATFLTGFVLVAMVPTSIILFSLGIVLVATGLLLIVGLRVWQASAGIAVIALLATGAATWAPESCDRETVYHCARIVADNNRPGGRLLLLDRLRHSYVDLKDPLYLEFSYIKTMASVADVMRPAGEPLRALHIGGGAFTLPRYLAATRPGGSNVAFEIDKGVIDLNHDHLGLEKVPDLTVRQKDARTGVGAEPTASRDLVIGDAFGAEAVPWHLATTEFATEIRRVLKPAGIYAINVIDHPPLRLVRAETATLADVFRHVAIAATPDALAKEGGGNFVILASQAPLPIAALQQRLAERNPSVALLTAPAVTEFMGDAPKLTDDYAPVDQLLTP